MSIGNRKVINPFAPLLQRMPKGLRHTRLIISGIFVLWLLLFDKADVLTQLRLRQTVKSLEKDKVMYEHLLKDIEQQRQDMDLNKEKFARERYFMKTPDEDVFIIEKVEK